MQWFTIFAQPCIQSGRNFRKYSHTLLTIHVPEKEGFSQITNANLKNVPVVGLTTTENGDIRELTKGQGTTKGGTLSGVDPGPVTECLHCGQTAGTLKQYMKDSGWQCRKHNTALYPKSATDLIVLEFMPKLLAELPSAQLNGTTAFAKTEEHVSKKSHLK